MYTTQDQSEVRESLRRRTGVLLLLLLVFIAGAAFLFIQRMYIPVSIWSCVILGVCLFVLDNAVLPLRRYGRFLEMLLSGKTHEESGVFVALGEDTEKEGIPCHVWVLSDGDGEFNIYLDARKDWRTPQEGERVTLSVYQNMAFAEEASRG